MEAIMTNHPATLIMLKDDLEKGNSRVAIGQGGDEQEVRMEIFNHCEHGITALFYSGKDDDKPFCISGLTLEQADALGWIFCKIC